MPDWTDATNSPPPEAFWIDPVMDAPGSAASPSTAQSTNPPRALQAVVGMVRHAGQAFVATAQAGTVDPAALPDTVYQAIAHRYLVALDAALGARVGLHRDVLAALGAASTPYCFGWLHIGWGDPAVKGPIDPYASFWLGRHQGGAVHRKVADRTLVLLAGRRLHGLSMGGDIGLRLALHVDLPDAPAASGLLRVRIFGVTLSHLDRALAPLPKRFADAPPDKRLALAETLLLQINTEISDKLGFEPGSLVHSVRPVGDDAEGLLRVEGRGVKRRQVSGGPPARGRVFSFSVDVDALQQIRHVRTLAIDELASSAHRPVADAGVRPGLTVFERDPASCGPAATLAQRRPTRSDAQLNGWRVNLDGPLHPQPYKTLTLGDAPLFEVQGPKARDGQASTLATTASALVQIDRQARLALRSDETAAAQAHLRATELFVRLAAYGLDADSYFRHARLPLVLRPRSAMRGAPDGDAINAEVRPFWAGNDFPAQQTLAAARPAMERPQLLVKFASADPAHRKTLGLPDDPARQRAQYLGIAADPRWAWHEFGHVLNFASTGELEFAFAHSAGDALAAIATDPDSALAWDADARCMTFPWVQVARRHDRSVASGYCWCGPRNRLRLATDRPLSRHRHGYFEEQLLSSSLFRLYRCLGGDTRSGSRPPAEPASRSTPEDDDTLLRREASDYCVYLVMRAISLLGPDSVAPARTPDQLVSALIDADLGTGEWSVDARWPFRRDHLRVLRRRGGQVHKVIRWAFEQQGLYATSDPLATAETIGLPPPVDLFIADRRSPRNDGGYHPVALRPAGAAGAAGMPWLAHAEWLWRDSTGLWLRVGNRGQLPAIDVTAQVWVRPDGDDRAAWQALGGVLPIADALAPTPAGALPPHRLALPDGLADAALWVLVSVTCAADPSHLAAGNTPPTGPAELLALVAHDNNLALGHLPASTAKRPPQRRAGASRR